MVWHGTIAQLGRLPRWPQDAAHILDAESVCEEWIKTCDAKGKVDGRALCMSLFSHRWSRPSLNPSEAFPDTAENDKAKALARYGKGGQCPIFAPHHEFDYYYVR